MADRPPPPPISNRSMIHHNTQEVSHIAECTYTHGRWTPPPIDHRSMIHHNTQEVSHMAECTYTHGRWTPQVQCIMGCIWQHFWILQEKVGICFYFWIIRVVISQHCRLLADLTPFIPQHPQNTPKMTITNFNYGGSYLPGLTCNMVVRAQIWQINWQISPPGNCHLVVRNGNFTFLATIRVHIARSTGRYIFYIRTSSNSCNYDTTWLNISDTSVHHICVLLKWINQVVLHMLHQMLQIQLWKHQHHNVCLLQ